MSDCTHHWMVTSECPMCLRARLAEAEALLRENCGQIPQPLGWFERVRMFLGIADSASANCVCVRPHLATDANGLTYCTGCGAVYSRPAADQPSIAESKMFQGADGNWYTETIITFGAHK